MSNPMREIARAMDKRAKQSRNTTNINEGGSGPSAADITHNHDDRYYRKTETDTKLSTKSDTTHSHTLEGLSDVPPYAGQAGKIVKVNATENGVEYGEATGGASAFTSLTDAPASYTGQSGKVVAVKSTEDGLEFVGVGQATNGLPSGGTTGQVLSKVDSTDYNAEWVDAPTGGTVYANPIDEPPSTPHAMDDEFDGTSLDAKWSWVNQGAASVSFEASALKFSAPNGGVTCRGIVQAKPASNDFTIIIKHLGSSYWDNYSKTGILLSESATGKQLGIWHAYDGAWRGLMGEFFTTPTSRFDFAYHGPSVLPVGGYIKARVYYTTEWLVDFYYSLNGYVWTLAKSGLALGFVPNYVGIGLDFEFSSTGQYWMCDWFRVTEP